MTQQAKISPFSGRTGPYICQLQWPERTTMNCGDSGIVLEGGRLEEALTDTDKAVEVIEEVIGVRPTVRRTAYFEVYLRRPWTFIRGEGTTIEEAEASSWNQYQRYLNCPGPNGHEYEARGYENGLGFCKWCGLSRSHAIAPTHRCQTCNEPTWCFKDVHGNYWCEDHYRQVPEDCLSETDIKLRNLAKRMEVFNKSAMDQTGIALFHNYGEYPGAAFATLAEVRAAVAHAMEDARQEAIENTACPCQFERETFIATSDRRGDQCDPFPGAEAHTWGGTVSEIKTIIDDCLMRCPEVQEIRIEGGFDGADSEAAFKADDYTPWISDFSVVVWKRPTE